MAEPAHNEGESGYGQVRRPRLITRKDLDRAAATMPPHWDQASAEDQLNVEAGALTDFVNEAVFRLPDGVGSGTLTPEPMAFLLGLVIGIMAERRRHEVR